MKTSRHVVIFLLVFIILSGAYTTFFTFATRANNEALLAYEERHTLTSAMYDINLNFTSLTRLMRVVVVTGGEIQYNVFWAELAYDVPGQTLSIFTDFEAPENEIELLRQIISRRELMNAISIEAIELRTQGYIEQAIALGHSPEFAYLGLPLEGLIREVIILVDYRIGEVLDSALIRAEIFHALMITAAALIALAGFLMLAASLKSRLVRIVAAVLVVLAAANVVSSVAFVRRSNEKFATYEMQDVLIDSLYQLGLGTEALSRWSRMVAVAGDEFHYLSYREELERDRFTQALDTFIVNRAPDTEVNVLIDLIRRITGLRHIEADFIQLRFAGYRQEAIDMAFGPEFAALGLPLNPINQVLRETVRARISGELAATARMFNILRMHITISTWLIFIVGIAVLLLMHNNVAHEVKKGSNILQFKWLKNATITTKLIASFAVIIILFNVYVVTTIFFNATIDELNRHNTESISPRVETILIFHQEFSEMRRILRESFMNSEWRATANEGMARSFEQRVRSSYSNLLVIAEEFKASVRSDALFPEQPYDSRILAMSDIMAYTTLIFETFNRHFFWDSDRAFTCGNVLDYAVTAESMLQMIRRIASVNQGIVAENIEQYRSMSNIITITVLVVAVVLAVFLSYLMVKTFTGRIKDIEAKAALVAKGDFEATLQNRGTDEISKIFTNLVRVFTNLIDEIRNITNENKRGNLSARISSNIFQGGYKESAIAINVLLDTIEEMLDQKEKMQIAQANSQAKSKFLANMSHEIRTPLTSVLGIAEIQLHNTSLPLDIEEAFAKIYSSSSTLLGIVNDILDLSKIEAGKMEINNNQYEVASLLSDIAQLNLAYLGSKQIDFVIDIDENIPSVLIGDELRIKQVLNNLISNAFKYTDRGRIGFSVQMVPMGFDYINMVIIISDTGRGMDSEQLKGLFDEYSRFHEKEFRFEEGTGLGMPITYNLLQMMSGTIDVISKIGKGTTVTVNLPQQIGSTQILGAETARLLKNFNIDAFSTVKRLSFMPEPMPNGRVLVVDDVDANLYVAEGLLGLYQLRVDTCTSGLAAIEKIRKGEVYDIIFMDQMMPQMDGMETTATIRQMNYNHPIVALTANALVGQAEEFLRSGFDGFLSKPIQTTHLNAVLHKFIKAEDVEHKDVDEYFENYMADSGIKERLCRDFARRQKDAVNNIIAEIRHNDFKAAHRLAHTLKGLAGLIDESRLSSLAAEAEKMLANGEVWDELIETLSLEMEHVLAGIEIKYPRTSGAAVPQKPKAQAHAEEIFDRLEKLLETKNADALEMADALATIPNTEGLIEHIMNFDFTDALEVLKGLRLEGE